MYDGDLLAGYAAIGVFIVGTIGLIVAFFVIRSDVKEERRQEDERLRRNSQRVAAVLIAVVLTGVLLSADGMGACSEANLRAVEAITGIPWEVLYYTFGCYMLPG
jgi:hypothetical protein